jgi:hypothetical protein
MMSVATLAVLLASCGGDDGEPACGPPLSGSCTSHTGFYCTEYAGVPDAALAAIMASCTRADSDGKQGQWSSGGCSHSGATGACKQMQAGTCAAVWLYIASASEGQKQCTAQGGTWVDP